MKDRRSITAFAFYIAGGVTIFISLLLLNAPTEETFGPGLIGLLLGFIMLGVGRANAHLSRIRDLLEGKGGR